MAIVKVDLPHIKGGIRELDPGHLNFVRQVFQKDEAMREALEKNDFDALYQMNSESHGMWGTSQVGYMGADVLTTVFLLCGIDVLDYMTAITDFMFADCHDITSVVVPSNITKIYGGAFSHCISLSQIVLPETLEELCMGAFRNTAIREIKFPAGIGVISEDLCNSCEYLKTVEIPEGITAIGRDAFTSCWLLEEVKIPASIKSFGMNVFFDCPHLRHITYAGTKKQLADPQLGFLDAFDGRARQADNIVVSCSDGDIKIFGRGGLQYYGH